MWQTLLFKTVLISTRNNRNIYKSDIISHINMHKLCIDNSKTRAYEYYQTIKVTRTHTHTQFQSI